MKSQLIRDLTGFRVVPEGCQEPHGLPLNPLRTRVWKDEDGWCARYRRRYLGGMEGWEIRSCPSAAQARAELRHFVRMQVAQVDGKFVEVVRA